MARKDAWIAELEGQVATLTSQVAALTKQVAERMGRHGRNSRNSHLPPSSDPPGKRGPPVQGKDKPGTRKRGGQPGHGGSRRTRLPPSILLATLKVEAVLARAVAAGIDGLSGSCADILEHKAALWTFVTHDDVEPTKNHAEREIRAFVLWRKRSYGAQSDPGNLFAERVMTVAHTARKQNKNVLLTACCRGRRPSLFVPDVATA